MYLVNQSKTQVIKMRGDVCVRIHYTHEMREDAAKYRVAMRDELRQTTSIHGMPYNVYDERLQNDMLISESTAAYIAGKYPNAEYDIVCRQYVLATYPNLESAKKELTSLIHSISCEAEIYEFTERNDTNNDN